jgi:hypothetical protein
LTGALPSVEILPFHCAWSLNAFSAFVSAMVSVSSVIIDPGICSG